MPKQKDTPFQFEAALTELNTLVEQMEQGNISLEDSLTCFEKGINLTRQCQKALSQAEQKVQKLVNENGQDVLEDFTPADDSNSL